MYMYLIDYNLIWNCIFMHDQLNCIWSWLVALGVIKTPKLLHTLIFFDDDG